jgi:hypothetical protein
LLKDVAPEVPDKIRHSIYVKLRDKDRTVYDRANDAFEEWLEAHQDKLLASGIDGFTFAGDLVSTGLVKIGYLRRIVGQAKVYAAAEWIARAVRVGEPVVAFCEHKQVWTRISRLLRRQRIEHHVLHGEIHALERKQMVDDFQAGRVSVFIGTRAAKEGITLTAARHMLFIERFYTSAEEEQAEDRIHRIGQEHKTHIWYLHAHGTVDERIDEIVREKRELIQKQIGSHTYAEADRQTDEQLLARWRRTGPSSPHKVESLGLSKLSEVLPLLPDSTSTHAISFEGWAKGAALRWCRMNGYQPKKTTPTRDGFQFVIRPAPFFRQGSFRSRRITRGVKVIHGDLLSQANRRKIRRSLTT